MESNEQSRAAHEGSASPAHLSPSPPPATSADVVTPTKGNAAYTHHLHALTDRCRLTIKTHSTSTS